MLFTSKVWGGTRKWLRAVKSALTAKQRTEELRLWGQSESRHSLGGCLKQWNDIKEEEEHCCFSNRIFFFFLWCCWMLVVPHALWSDAPMNLFFFVLFCFLWCAPAAGRGVCVPQSADVFSLDDKGRKNALLFFHLRVTSLRAKRNPRCHSERERERNCN